MTELCGWHGGSELMAVLPHARSILGGEEAYQRQVDVDFFRNFEDEPAGVFEAPFDVGDFEGGFGSELVAVDVELHGDGEGVRGSVEGEDSRDLEGGVAVEGERAGVGLGDEGDVGELGGLEDVVEHFFVAAGVAGVAGGGGDVDEAGEVG